MQRKLERWINWMEFDEVVAGKHNAPHNILGLHNFGEGQVVTVFRPHAQKVFVMNMNGDNVTELEEVEEETGFFGKYVDSHIYKAPYKVRVQYSENDIIEFVDPYCFSHQISDMALYVGRYAASYENSSSIRHL